MPSHHEFTDQQFETAFENGTLPASLFNHEAHLRLAWIHVSKYGVEKAGENVNRQLIAFVTQLGAQDKYNKTLTTAAVKAVNHFIQRSVANNFVDFIEAVPRLKTNFKDLMACHYNIDIFQSPLAKSNYIEPQLLPFD